MFYCRMWSAGVGQGIYRYHFDKILSYSIVVSCVSLLVADSSKMFCKIGVKIL